MRQKLNIKLLRQITEKELDNISENEIWLSELVEQVADRYSKLNHYLHSLSYKKIKKSDFIVSNIAKSFGWVSKRKSTDQNIFINGKWIRKRNSKVLLCRLQEEE